MISLKLIGAKRVAAALKKSMDKMRDATTAAIYQKGFQIMADSVKICPEATGRLINTAYVAPPKFGQMHPVVTLGYGTNYAWFVHEMGSGTGWSKPGSSGKYLEKPFDKHTGGYLDWIAKKAKQNFDRGLTVKSVSTAMPIKPDDKGRAWQKSRGRQLRAKLRIKAKKQRSRAT